MKTNRHTCRRAGFTFVELLVSILASSILLVGLNAALFVSLKASDTSLTPVRATNEGLGLLAEISADLQFAIGVTEATATSISIVVPDRDADSYPETIRYAWSGTIGAPLTRTFNSGAETEIVDDVHSLYFTYLKTGSLTRHVSVRLQIGPDARAAVETGVGLLNRP